MAEKFKIKKGDQVVVLTGRDKGKKGEVLEVLRAESRLRVQGVNMVKRHRGVSTPSMVHPRCAELRMAVCRWATALASFIFSHSIRSLVAGSLGADILWSVARTAPKRWRSHHGIPSVS